MPGIGQICAVKKPLIAQRRCARRKNAKRDTASGISKGIVRWRGNNRSHASASQGQGMISATSNGNDSVQRWRHRRLAITILTPGYDGAVLAQSQAMIVARSNRDHV